MLTGSFPAGFVGSIRDSQVLAQAGPSLQQLQNGMRERMMSTLDAADVVTKGSQDLLACSDVSSSRFRAGDAGDSSTWVAGTARMHRNGSGGLSSCVQEVGKQAMMSNELIFGKSGRRPIMRGIRHTPLVTSRHATSRFWSSKNSMGSSLK